MSRRARAGVAATRQVAVLLSDSEMAALDRAAGGEPLAVVVRRYVERQARRRRPPELPPRVGRMNRVSVAVTEAEHERWREAAGGLTLADYVRGAMFGADGGLLPTPPPASRRGWRDETYSGIMRIR